MKNVLRIVMTLSLLVFASSAVLRASDMVGADLAPISAFLLP